MKPINYDEKKKILIVDDETDVSLALKMALEGNNFEVDAFNEALLGFQLYREIKKKTIK